MLVLGLKILDDEDTTKMSFITSIQANNDFQAESKFGGWLDEKAILVLGHQIQHDEDASKMSFIMGLSGVG